MSKGAKIAIGLLGVLLILGIALFFFVRYEIRKSFSPTEGTVALTGLADLVEVTRDEYGVPAIEARNNHDLMFALGYVHAQDRLWQMDITRRLGQGRLSELLGDATIPFDRMFRIVGIRRIAEEVERRLPGETRDMLQWYADGVNAFITSRQGKYPIEFDLLQYNPEPWQPVHSLIIGRLMAWELNLSWWTDLTFGAIAERVGLEKALDIAPPYPGNVAPTVPVDAWKAYAELSNGYLKVAHDYAELIGTASIAGGSNAWAVAPRKSATGAVLLANDTHLRLQVPSKWYEVSLRAPQFNVRGMSIAGIPCVVSGRNDLIAWGVTNLMADDADFYVEQIDATDTTKYMYDGVLYPITYLEEEIGVRNQPGVPLMIRLTRHGPIVTDVRTMLQKGSAPYVASMRWTGAEPDDQLQAFFMMDRARNWQEFSEGVKRFPGPGQNFIYGDVDGNIGYWCGAKLPIRTRRSSLLPLPGWEKENDWKGFVPPDKLPHLYNPPEGFVASANNKVVDDTYPYYISDLWEPPSRIVRLREKLGGKNEGFDIDDFQRLQNDKFSNNAKEILPYIAAAFKDSALGLAEDQQVKEYFRNWNFVYSTQDIPTSIYQEFLVHFLRNVYADEMGDDLFHDFLVLANVPIRVTTKLVEEGTSSWFDDIRTDARETRDDMIRKSLREAVAALRTRFGDEMKMWRWGDLHTVTLQHPFGLKKPLDRIFNIGPFPYGGASTALMSGEYDLNDPFATVIAASYRQIFDLGVSARICSVLPSGESGQVFNPHYSDQTELWLNGAYRATRWNDAPAGEHLHLEPSR
jgi:penicillin G amidase